MFSAAKVWLRRIYGYLVGARWSASPDPTDAELQEFLEADDLPDYADRAFKERLREQLWEDFVSRRR
jgi:hypothetical protein